MDLLMILGGAAAAAYGLIAMDGGLGKAIGWLGLTLCLVGLYLNHLRHQSRK